MTDLTVNALCCAQCGRPLPPEQRERARWRPHEAAAGELDELTPAMLLCPDCAEEDRIGAYDAGDVD